MPTNAISAIPFTILDSATLSINYNSSNVAVLSEACIILRINNASNAAIIISYDGITDNEFLPANGVLQIDAQTNSQPSNYVCMFKKGTIIYFKGVAGVGRIAVSGYYQAGV